MGTKSDFKWSFYVKHFFSFVFPKIKCNLTFSSLCFSLSLCLSLFIPLFLFLWFSVCLSQWLSLSIVCLFPLSLSFLFECEWHFSKQKTIRNQNQNILKFFPHFQWHSPWMTEQIFWMFYFYVRPSNFAAHLRSDMRTSLNAQQI